MSEAEAAATIALWLVAIGFAGVVAVDIIRDWREERRHVRRMARPVLPGLFGGTTPEFSKSAGGPVAVTVTADTTAAIKALSIASWSIADIQAGAARMQAVMTCSIEGHVWVTDRRLCSPTLSVCSRCGLDPATDMPLLWEGDNA